MLSRPVAVPKPTRKPVERQRLARVCRRKKVKPVVKERRRKALARIQAEREAKEEVRERDQHCRWPGCDCCYAFAPSSIWRSLEVAHLKHKGMGGDKRLIRTQRNKMILLCRLMHQSQIGLHSGLAKIEPMTRRGTDGLCAFWRKQKDGSWYLVGEG
jgi:hypothetical protein